MRTGPFGDRYGEVPDGLTLQQVKDSPHGIDLGPMVPRLPEVLATTSGTLVLAPEYILGDLPRLGVASEVNRVPSMTCVGPSARLMTAMIHPWSKWLTTSS